MAANVSNTTLQSQFGTIGSSSNRSATSERDFSVSPRDEDLNYSTPPLLLPSDLLASSPAAGAKDSLATQAYLEAYSLIAKSPNKKERGRRRTRRSTKDESEHEEEISQPPGRSSSSIIPKNSSTTIQSPESAVPEALSSLFSAARNTGGVIKSTTSGGQSTESRPVFHAEIERNIAELGTVVQTSETNIDKYEFSGTESTDSDEPKIYEKVYDKEERWYMAGWPGVFIVLCLVMPTPREMQVLDLTSHQLTRTRVEKRRKMKARLTVSPLQIFTMDTADFVSVH